MVGIISTAVILCAAAVAPIVTGPFSDAVPSTLILLSKSDCPVNSDVPVTENAAPTFRVFTSKSDTDRSPIILPPSEILPPRVRFLDTVKSPTVLTVPINPAASP